MNHETSFQQLRAPIAMALTAALTLMFAPPSGSYLVDPSKVENPIILAAILLAFLLVIWNHPPSLATSGATLLILSVLAHSRGNTQGDFDDSARPLWFAAGLLLGSALAFVARKHVRSTLSQVSGWRYILHPARLAEAIIGIGVVIVLFRPSNPQFIHVEHADTATSEGSLLFWLTAGVFITLLSAVSPTATIICLAASVWLHGVDEYSAFPTSSTVSVLFVLVLAAISPLFVLHDPPAQETEESATSTDDSAAPADAPTTSPKEAS